jgi:pimeloyl-ACP methyl ester carboxylesterase
MSYGGLVSIKFAGDHSESISGLVIVDTGPDLRVHGAEEIRDFTEHDQVMDSVEDFVKRAILFNSRRRPELLRNSLLYNLRKLPSGRWTWKWDWRRLHLYDLEVLRNQMAELWQSVATITCATLIVRGAHSNVFLPEDGEKLAAAIPGSELKVVENSGHTVQGDNAQGLLEVLEPFLARVFDAWTP